MNCKRVSNGRARILTLGLFIYAVCPLLAASPISTQSKVPGLALTDMHLNNGLRVILVPDHAAPVVAICVTYKVGSRDEQRGHTGVAHLLEHLMFEGSENVGKGEHFLLTLNNGGRANATTTEDRTDYFEELPRNQLELGLFLEADRMRALKADQSNLDNQRKSVKEERRLRIDNQPYGRSYLEIDKLSYDNFAYGHSVLGESSDLDAATLEKVRQFSRTYYGPNNAVLTLVGDFEVAEAIKRVRKYFGSIPSVAPPPNVDLSDLPLPGEKRETIYDPLARLPQIILAYRIPPGDTPDNYAMQLLATILGTGRSSRLYRTLVEEKHLANEVEVQAEARTGPSQFHILASPGPGVNVADLEKAINDELAGVARDGVTPDAVSRALTQIRRGLIQERQSVLTTAINIGTFAANFDDPNLINTTYFSLSTVTPERIRFAASKYLATSCRAILTTVPAGAKMALPSGTIAMPEKKELETAPTDRSVPIGSVRRLNRAPVDRRFLSVHLRRPSIHRLPNGLTVLVLEHNKLPTVAFEMWIKGGALADPKELPGLASFTAEILLEGTTHRSSADIAAQLDDIGGSLSASSDFGSSYTTVKASGLAENANTLVEMLSDIVLHPSFRSDELEHFRWRKRAELEQLRTQPDFLAEERLMRAIYGNSSAAPVSATVESIERLTTEDLRSFHHSYFTPENSILGVVGSVKTSTIMSLIERHFGGWPEGQAASPAMPTVPPATARKILLVDRPGSVQTTVVAGNLALTRTDPDFYALWVMNRILGGATGRLLRDLREEKGYAYVAGSSFAADLYPGFWGMTTTVDTVAIANVLGELLSEIRRIRESPVSADELVDNRHAIISRFALSLEQPQDLLEDWLTVQYYRLPQTYWDTYPTNISKVDQEAVARAARKYVDLDHLQIVCVGDVGQIEYAVSTYAPVELFDTNGAQIH